MTSGYIYQQELGLNLFFHDHVLLKQDAIFLRTDKAGWQPHQKK